MAWRLQKIRETPLFWMRKVRHYQLTQNLALTIKPCRPVFKWFAGKTNRVALYSLSLCGWELDLYIARNWDYPAGDDVSEDMEDNRVSTGPSDRRTDH